MLDEERLIWDIEGVAGSRRFPDDTGGRFHPRASPGQQRRFTAFNRDVILAIVGTLRAGVDRRPKARPPMTISVEPVGCMMSRTWTPFYDLLPALACIALRQCATFFSISAPSRHVSCRTTKRISALALTDDGSQFRLYASTRGGVPEVVCRGKGLPDRGGRRASQLFDTVPGPERGLRSGLTVPVRIDDRLVGVFALFSASPRAHALTRDLILAERLAGYVAVALAHQRLAEAARHAAVERERAASVESSVELLRAISDVLDIRILRSSRVCRRSRTRCCRMTASR